MEDTEKLNKKDEKNDNEAKNAEEIDSDIMLTPKQLKEKKKKIVIIFLSGVIALSIIIFACFFEFSPESPKGVMYAIYKGSEDNSDINIFREDFQRDKIGIVIDNKNIDEIKYNSVTKFNVEIYFYSDTIDMSNMFTKTNLMEVNLTSNNDLKITSMESAFENCIYLEKFSIQGHNTNELKSMKNIFNGCSKLNSIDITTMKIDNNITMENAFTGTAIKEISLVNFKLDQIIGYIKQNVFPNDIIIYVNENENLTDNIYENMYYNYSITIKKKSE